MALSFASVTSFRVVSIGVAVSTAAWSLYLLLAQGDLPAVQEVSNLGLLVAALAAALAGMRRARRSQGRIARFWFLLGSSALAWGVGQAVWTWKESVLGQPMGEPSLADIGYLGFMPLAMFALLALPAAAPTLAGRVRTVLDGLMIAGSLLLISYVLVLDSVMQTSEHTFGLLIALAYPLGDVVVITLVLYTLLRLRQERPHLPAALPLVGLGLVAICVADSGFAYLGTLEMSAAGASAYESGHPIDIGWFLGFGLLLLAARHPAGDEEVAAVSRQIGRPLGMMLPYVAVTGAVMTSVAMLLVTGGIAPFVSWTRTALMVLLMARQILTLVENHELTQDLEDRVAARTAELAASEQRFAALVQHSSDVVTIVDIDGRIHYQSASSHRVFGYLPEELLGTCIAELVDGEEAKAAFLAALADCARTPYQVKTPQTFWRDARGAIRHVEVTVTNLLEDAAVGGLVLNSRDITDRKVLEDRLVHQAFHDSLTALANRPLFTDRIEHAVARGGARAGTVAVLFLDLDGFKEINDTLGHSAGDLLLVQIAERLRAAVRPGDTVARLGGDEFAILVEELGDERVLRDLAERILDVLQQPLLLEGQEVHPRGSIGIAARTAALEDAEQLLRNADLAMYGAKSAGGGGYAQYDPQMHAHRVERSRRGAELRRAIDQGDLELHYQPLIDLRGGHITGVEALVRWRHPEDGLISPNDFIPLAESSGLIHPLGHWILREACRQAAEWQRSSPLLRNLQLNVNMSSCQLLRADVADQVADVLHETGLTPQSLVLEMTESVLMEHSEESLRGLRGLKQLGIRLAIDDFGTGYSSLSYLHRFPVDILKIDRSFVERIGGDADLVSTIVQLGRAMHLETVAEGIEERAQLLVLRRLGCNTGQGFHFSRPLPAAEFTGLLARWGVGAMFIDQEALAV